jgi:signal transduction histidine kinase
MIYTKVIALNHLITDLFQLTTLEARRIPFTIQSIRLTDYKQHLQERFELDIQNAALVFQITLAEQLTQHGARIEIDLDRMDQVFTNLIFNSIRYTQAGGIIHIQLERGQEGHLLIRVQDTGSGIAEEDLSFVFDRFYKGNKSRSGKSEGSGLGLAICKEIVESHGGNIWVESKSNEGSVFCFILPLLLEESTDELVTS